jgi:L-asparaginase II
MGFFANILEAEEMREASILACVLLQYSVGAYLANDHEMLPAHLIGYVGNQRSSTDSALAFAILIPAYGNSEDYALEDCDAPGHFVPLADFALGMARLECPQSVSEPIAQAAVIVTTAMITHPELVSGNRRLTSALVRITDGRLIVKGGADGGQAAIDRQRGLPQS